MMTYGITGSRHGMNPKQLERFVICIRSIKVQFQFRHGDCVGVDGQAHSIIEHNGGIIYVHPPTDDSFRAFCQGSVTYATKPYIERNHDVVDSIEVLFVAGEFPENATASRRSGTWATKRYAQGRGKIIVDLDNQTDVDHFVTHCGYVGLVP